MLSILIPTYNYDIYALVAELQEQCIKCGIVYEIITLDDGSELYHYRNNDVNSLENCSYSILEKNIGRSSIRNLLATKANYRHMLFLDADVFPTKSDFIENYVRHISTEEKIVAGGLRYESKVPEKNLRLRWVYGSKREAIPVDNRREKPYQSFLSSNFLITKALIGQVPFNESIPDLRREDTLFSYDLMRHKIKVEHIDNPVYHLGLDEFETAMRKENESLDGLKYALRHKLLPDNYLKICRLYTSIHKLRLNSVFYLFHKIARPLYFRNLSGENPSLYIFDLYRIGYLCRNDQ